jgi:hypothetical protein
MHQDCYPLVLMPLRLVALRAWQPSSMLHMSTLCMCASLALSAAL